MALRARAVNQPIPPPKGSPTWIDHVSSRLARMSGRVATHAAPPPPSTAALLRTTLGTLKFAVVQLDQPIGHPTDSEVENKSQGGLDVA